MNQVLTQSEVDALLSSVYENTDAAVSAYDLTKQNSKNTASVAPQEKVLSLDIIYERFTRLFGVSLSNSLRKNTNISVISTDQHKHSEFINTLPESNCTCTVHFDSFVGPAFFVFESKLIYALVDSYFGGAANPYLQGEEKEFTTIELSIIKKVTDLAVHDFQEAWAPVHGEAITCTGVEIGSQTASDAASNQVFTSTAFEVELGNTKGTVILAIPFTVAKQEVWTETLSEHLNHVEADLRVNLGEVNITVGDLLNLKTGDIIPLSQSADGELCLLMEGVPKFSCLFGESRGNRAVQVTRPWQGEKND